MNPVAKRNLFQWTLRGKPYLLLLLGSIAMLILSMGVM